MIDAGVIVAEGTHDALLESSPLYRQLAGTFAASSDAAVDPQPDHETARRGI